MFDLVWPLSSLISPGKTTNKFIFIFKNVIPIMRANKKFTTGLIVLRLINDGISQ
jgi:hypothetical protein